MAASFSVSLSLPPLMSVSSLLAGRKVYGGGGITPDEHIDQLKSNKVQDTLLSHYAFFNYSKHYMATHTVQKDFTVDAAVLTDFESFLKLLLLVGRGELLENFVGVVALFIFERLGAGGKLRIRQFDFDMTILAVRC